MDIKIKNILVVGLGSMGFGIAQSLIRAGYSVYGQDKNLKQQKRLIEEGGYDKNIPFNDLQAVIIVVLNEKQTREIIFGQNGISEKLKKNSLIMVCTTVAPDFAKEMASSCNDKGLLYLDAPISGGSKKSAEGKLSYMISGSPKAFEVAKPILDCTSETVFEFGEHVGSGSAMKAVNQMLAGVHIAAMAEAITFGITQGIDPKRFLEVISKCAGTSWMLENRTPHIIDNDYSPKSSINIWPKDLGIVLDIAKNSNFPAPLTAAALQQFISAAGSGLGQEDDAAVAKIYARNAGIKLPQN
jgi:3-hydroxyisobutyrate dehydrogenase-like beta-hydroxyacid dehydrogenase|tara:strand:- start:1144 stop:2040 length:897 start_codon:yes stop_codon:yes gene_type:complete